MPGAGGSHDPARGGQTEEEAAQNRNRGSRTQDKARDNPSQSHRPFKQRDQIA